MNINYKQQLTQQMVGEYLMLFENYTRSKLVNSVWKYCLHCIGNSFGMIMTVTWSFDEATRLSKLGKKFLLARYTSYLPTPAPPFQHLMAAAAAPGLLDQRKK